MKNKKIIMPIKDKKTGELYIPLTEFSEMIDISLVCSYSIEKPFLDRLLDEKTLILKFYDKDDNLLIPLIK